MPILRIKILHTKLQYIVMSALSYHLVLGAVALFTPTVMGATPLSLLADTVGRNQYALGAMLISASVAAYVALSSGEVSLRTLFLLVPLMTLMLILAGGAIKAVGEQKFLDGVERPFGFVFASELAYIVGALYYLLAILDNYGGNAWKLILRSRRSS